MSITQRDAGYLLQNTASLTIGGNTIAIPAALLHTAQLIYKAYRIIAELTVIVHQV